MSKKDAHEYSGIVGEDGFVEDPNVWARHYLRVCRSNGWEDDEDKLANITMYFTHEAEVWYDIQANWIETEGRTWEQFMGAFSQRFLPANYMKQLRKQLEKPKQQEHESVRAYTDRYQRLWSQVGRVDLDLDELMDNWVAGLFPDLKEEVRHFEPATFDGAVL